MELKLDRRGCLPRSGVLLITGLPRTLALGAFAKYFHVKLPALHVFPGLFVGDDHHKLRNLSTSHPFVQLRHYLLDVCLDLVIRRHYHTKLDWGCEGTLCFGMRWSKLLGKEKRTEHIQAIFLDTVGN